MPTDLSVAIERRVRLNREIAEQQKAGILVIPLGICVLTVIMSIESPAFASFICATALY